MNMTHKHILVPFAFLVMAATPVHAETSIPRAAVVTDDFSLSGERKAGGMLDGATASTNLSWRTAPAFIFDGNKDNGRIRACLGRVDEYRDFAPDLVVVQFGENEKPGAGSETFADDYATLLKEVSGLASKPQILACGLWAPHNGTPYQGRTAEVDATIEQVARAHGAGFASVQRYAMDPACRGFGATDGVRWHPNDAGMKGYAEALFGAWQPPKGVVKGRRQAEAALP